MPELRKSSLPAYVDLKSLIQQEGISPTDICLIYNGKAGQILESQLKPMLKEFDVELSMQRNRPFERQANTLVATTRARSLLGIYGVRGGSTAARKIGETIADCISTLKQH